jgi:hypothetical protein
MATRAVELIGSIIPLLIVIPLFGALAGGLFGGMFGTPQTRSVSRTNVTNVSRVELQKTITSTRRFYYTIFLKIKNNTGTTQNYYIRIGAFFDNQTDALVYGKILYTNKITLANGEVFADVVSSSVNDPSDSTNKLNKWVIAELGANADVLDFALIESEV